MNTFRIAGIDVHKAMLAVVFTADSSGEGEIQFERRKFGATPEQLRMLVDWLTQNRVQSAVMESTAQYWRPVWDAWSGIGSSALHDRCSRCPSLRAASSRV